MDLPHAPNSRQPQSVPAWWLLILPVAFIGVRCIFAPLCELFADEAYYWVWSRQLALGYFDHPPMVAWLIHLSTSLFGTNELTVRLPAILLGGGTIAAATWLAATLGATRRTLLLVQVVLCFFPMLHVEGAIITPDTPSLFFTIMATAAAVCCQRHPDRVLWWLVLGATAGLAMLSKYTTLLPIAVLLSCLLVTQRQRFYLPILAGAVALLVLSPLLIWNYQHDWISFRFQLSHGLTRDSRTLLMNVGDYIGAQLLVATPVLLPLLLWAGLRAVRGTDSAARLVALASLLPLAFFLYASCKHKVEANWPSLAWVPLLVLLVLELPAASIALQRFTRAGVIVAGVFTFVLMLPPALLAQLNKHAPTAKAGGWSLMANTIKQRSRNLPIVCASYQDAALFAFYLPGRPTISLLREAHDRPSQFDVWPMPDLTPGARFILVTDKVYAPGPVSVVLGNNTIAVQVIRSTPYHIKLDGIQNRDRVAVRCMVPERDAPATRQYISPAQ